MQACLETWEHCRPTTIILQCSLPLLYGFKSKTDRAFSTTRGSKAGVQSWRSPLLSRVLLESVEMTTQIIVDYTWLHQMGCEACIRAAPWEAMTPNCTCVESSTPKPRVWRICHVLWSTGILRHHLRAALAESAVRCTGSGDRNLINHHKSLSFQWQSCESHRYSRKSTIIGWMNIHSPDFTSNFDH